MRSKAILVVAIVLSVANIVSADVFDAGGANEFTIDFVNISGDTNPNNVFGIVNYDYRMGTYEITNGQWNAFVSAAGAPTGSEGGNIPGDAYEESAFWTGTDVPTNNVSWYEGAQFINWLNTSTGHAAAYKFTGTQGTGDYTFAVWEQGDIGFDTSNPYRNSNAYYFLPTEDEWVKAAYWNGTNLQTYATKDNTAPDKWSPAGGPNSDGQAAGWNYDYAYPNNNNSNDQPWDVTAGYSPEELNGTYDMMGNVWEWMESPRTTGYYATYAFRGVGGSSYADVGNFLRSSSRYSASPYLWRHEFGFRVASVPEPASIEVVVDIKPSSCPNPLNVKSKGVLPVAILGSDSFDVTTIDATSIRLKGVGPIRHSFEDVAAPGLDVADCNCVEDGPDGFVDLTLKFKTQEIVEALGEVEDGDVITLELTGVLLYDSMPFEMPIEGADCILIRGRHKPINPADVNKDGVVNAADFAIFTQNWLQSSLVDD